jgi:hypothetical protein
MGIGERELPVAGEPVAEGLALDERHGEPEPAGGVARVEDGEDVGVVQAGGGVDLALEPLGAEGRGEVGVEDLEGDQPIVLEIAGEEDGGHAAPPELSLECVAAAQPFLELRPQVGHARTGVEAGGNCPAKGRTRGSKGEGRGRCDAE